MVNCCCGLLAANKEAVPLKSVDVEVTVRDHVATVATALLYENQEQSPIEAVFVFPLPGDAAVCHFSAKIGQVEVVAEVREKQKAHEEYDDALSSGQQAFLLEESEQSPDVFSLSVGSLPPGESASIRLEYVTELAVQPDDGLRFCLPAVLNPRYQPRGSDGSGGGVSSGPGTTVPASLIPYSLSLSASVCSPRPITKVESNCSLDPVQYLNPQRTRATVKLASGHKFDRDVELLLYYKDSHLPTAVVEAGRESAESGSLMGDPVVMLSLYPEFPPAVMLSTAKSGEFLFVIDRSGSMESPMGHQGRSQLRIDKILEPLQHIFKQPCIPSQPRQLFVFTDGEVGNTLDVIDVVKRNSGSHRCFSFGIGTGASTALINGLAKEGRGHGQFITGADRMQSKVMQSLRFALQPAVVDISVTWDVPTGVSVTPLSPPIANLFQGQRSLIYTQLTGQVNARAVEVSVQSGVSSSLTAFIAVNKGNGEAVQGPLLRRDAPNDPMLQLVSLQRASGSWVLGSALAVVLGKTLKDVESSMPASVSPEVWATVLAVIWLHGFKMDAQVEWEFLAMKAVSWLHGEKVAGMTECVEAGNALLGCQVQESSMGL
ncbi:hypothetical protein CRUP_029882 [Coryphaenoides rupestris]|nr:hypothetical protein CRUP_029882 [Coryphaenoides rupestris]